MGGRSAGWQAVLSSRKQILYPMHLTRHRRSQMKRHLLKPWTTILVVGAILWTTLFQACADPAPSRTPISPPYSIDATPQLKIWAAGESIPVNVQCRVQGGKSATVKASVDAWVKVVAESSSATITVEPSVKKPCRRRFREHINLRPYYRKTRG